MVVRTLVVMRMVQHGMGVVYDTTHSTRVQMIQLTSPLHISQHAKMLGLNYLDIKILDATPGNSMRDPGPP
jgi:hypothetical protein